MDNSDIYKIGNSGMLDHQRINKIAKFVSIKRDAIKITEVGEFHVYEYEDGSVYYFKGLTEYSKDEFENYLLKERLKNIKKL